MQWYNKFGESSSLGTATEKAEYTTRYRGKRKIVNVISLTTLVESIPLTVKLWYLKTDMQGFDFDALRSAADILRSGRAQYVMSRSGGIGINRTRAKTTIFVCTSIL